MSLIQTIETDWNIIKADVGGFLKKVEGAIIYLVKEAPIVLAWAAKVDPALGGALGLLVRAGEAAAATLLHEASTGLGTQVDTLAGEIGTTMGNAIGAIGLNPTSAAALTADKVKAVNSLVAAAHAAIDAETAKILAILAPPAP